MITKSLDASTFDDFAQLAARNNGVWGGCWCLEVHSEGVQLGTHRRAVKDARVHQGRACAALVHDGADCIGRCQFGSPMELPRIKYRRPGGLYSCVLFVQLPR